MNIKNRRDLSVQIIQNNRYVALVTSHFLCSSDNKMRNLPSPKCDAMFSYSHSRPVDVAETAAVSSLCLTSSSANSNRSELRPTAAVAAVAVVVVAGAGLAP